VSRLAASIERVVDAIGRAVSWLTLGIVLLTFAIVVLRYAFAGGSIALQESVLWLHSAVFLLGAAFALKRDQHVRVDIFYREFDPRRKALADLAGTLLFLLPVAGFLVLISYEYVASAWAIREASREPGGLPGVFLLKTLIPIAGVLLFVQGIALVLRQIAQLRAARGGS
jgi:TRAP-type mannitol/chloroaromatic compound transport system permease small subunit